MERFFWATLIQRASASAPAATSSPSPIRAPRSRRSPDSRGYREVFVNPADIGGRFSALSLFGLVPTALIGALGRSTCSRPARRWRTAAGRRTATNPGLELGAFIGATAANGRDKLTVVLPPSLAIARSLDRAADRREHRQARQGRAAGRRRAARAARRVRRRSRVRRHRAPIGTTVDEHGSPALEAAGHPVLHLSTRLDGLGAEFFRWEFATAVAGAALGINPFDEPNVSEAKEKTKALLGALLPHRARLPEPSRPHRRNASTSSARTSPAARRRPSSARRSPRSRRRTTSRSSRTSRRTATSRRRSPRSAPASAAAIASPARSASARATCTRPGSTTRADRTPRSRSSSPRTMRRRRRFRRWATRSRC